MPDYDLYDINLTEVSSVPRGDNHGARMVFWKSDDTPTATVPATPATLDPDGPEVQALIKEALEDADAGGLEGYDPLAKANVSNRSWKSISQGDYTLEQWRRACLVGPSSASTNKGDYKFPVREPDGTYNREAIRSAIKMAGQGDMSAAERGKLRRKLASLVKNVLGEDVPDSLTKADANDGAGTGAGKVGGAPDGWLAKAARTVSQAFGLTPRAVEDVLAKSDMDPPSYDDMQRQKQWRHIRRELSERLESVAEAMEIAMHSPDPKAAVTAAADQFASDMRECAGLWAAGKSAMAKTDAGEPETLDWLDSLDGADAIEKAGRKISADRLRRLKAAHEHVGELIAEVDPDASGTTTAASGASGARDKRGAGDTADGGKAGAVNKGSEGHMALNRDELSDEVRQELERIEKERDDERSRSQRFAKAAGLEADPAPDPDEESRRAALAKMDPESRAYFEKLDREHAQDREALAKMQREDGERQAIAKAQADYGLSESEAKDFGPRLARIEKGEGTAEDMTELSRIVKATREQVDYSSLLAKRGSEVEVAGGGPVVKGDQAKTAIQKVEARAAELRKADPSMTPEAARAHVWENEPEYSEQYRREQEGAAV